MIYSVECGRKIKKYECRKFLLADSDKKVIVNAKEGCFSGMEFTICRLVGRERGKGVKMLI
jgi:hypothetical protein